MVDFVKRHLYQHATPGPLDFAHEQATSSKSPSSKNVPHLAQAPPPQAPPANAEIPTHEPSPPTNVKTMAKERQRAKSVGPNTKSPAQKQLEGMDGPAPTIVQTEKGKKKGKGWGKSMQKEVIAEALPSSSMPKAKGVPETLGPRPKSRGRNTKPKIAEALLPEPNSATPEPRVISKGVIKTIQKPKANAKPRPKPKPAPKAEPPTPAPKPEPKPSKTPYVIPPLRKKRTETPVAKRAKVTAKPPPEPKAKAPPPEPKAKAKASPPEPKAKAPEPKENPAYSKLVQHEKVTGMSEAWWKKQGIGVLKEQAQLRGHKFTDLEVKGDKSNPAQLLETSL